MPIPTSREELRSLVLSSYTSLEKLLDRAGDSAAGLPCAGDWTIKDLLAVRAWWSERVVDWVEAGRAGGRPVPPAAGFKWNETPRLNASIVATSRDEPYQSIRRRLRSGFERVVALIDSLSDGELLEAGVFQWAARWPIARWLSINTARQYSTAGTLVRRALLAARKA